MTDQTHRHTPGTDPTANLRVPAGKMAPWGVDTLPVPPPDRFDLRRFLGPGLLMVGLAIGGGEWLTGPALTAQYGRGADVDRHHEHPVPCAATTWR